MVTSKRSLKWHQSTSGSSSWNTPPQKKKTCHLKKGPFEKEMSSSNHQFSGDMLVFGGVVATKTHQSNLSPWFITPVLKPWKSWLLKVLLFVGYPRETCMHIPEDPWDWYIFLLLYRKNQPFMYVNIPVPWIRHGYHPNSLRSPTTWDVGIGQPSKPNKNKVRIRWLPGWYTKISINHTYKTL